MTVLNQCAVFASCRSWWGRPSCSAACPRRTAALEPRPTSTQRAATSTPSSAEPFASSVRPAAAFFPSYIPSAMRPVLTSLLSSASSSASSFIHRRPCVRPVRHGPHHRRPPADDGLPHPLLPHCVQAQLHHAERQLRAQPLHHGGHLLGGRPCSHQPGQVRGFEQGQLVLFKHIQISIS